MCRYPEVGTSAGPDANLCVVSGSGRHARSLGTSRRGDATWSAFAGNFLRGCWRGLRWLGEQVAEMLGEAVAAALACFLFVGFVLLVAWGFSLAPRSTVLLVAAVVAVAAYGGWRAWRDEPTVRRSLLVRVAVGWFAFVVVWLVYVLAYCSCV